MDEKVRSLAREFEASGDFESAGKLIRELLRMGNTLEEIAKHKFPNHLIWDVIIGNNPGKTQEIINFIREELNKVFPGSWVVYKDHYVTKDSYLYYKTFLIREPTDLEAPGLELERESGYHRFVLIYDARTVEKFYLYEVDARVDRADQLAKKITGLLRRTYA